MAQSKVLAKQNRPGYLSQVRSDPKYTPQNSYLWFQRKIKELFGAGPITPLNMLNDNIRTQTKSILPGRLYMYTYNPKTKDKLPYYDTFPLVFPFGKSKGSFIGLNLHYLNYPMRLMLMNKLMQFAVNNKKGDLAYLRFSWALLRMAARFPEAKPCVKRYLNSHVMSNFALVPSDEWMIAAMLPTASFKKARQEDVWKKSKEMVIANQHKLLAKED